MVLEMPVLDNALLACAVAFTPLMVALTAGEPVMKGARARRAHGPRGARPVGGERRARHASARTPRPSAAVLQGLFFGRTAPHRAERRTFTTPALVIGHHRDPVHPFSDAGLLAEELPNARLLEASSIVELRLAPERLTDEIADVRRRLLDARAPRSARRAAPRRAEAR